MIVVAFLCGRLAAAANAATNVMRRSVNRDISDWLQLPGRQPPLARRRRRRRDPG
jgi:hypothetical protein